ncbi:MAG TPA: GH1 family beta-glucosidase [Candidatus Acidoferrum sp.]|nr:GH1 family beta-glucosidase [Candidatus Acidoferrum sp.]
MSQWKNFNRREFLTSALGAAASFYILPPGSILSSEQSSPQRHDAPFQFSPQFLFGAATAAYQIEGAWNEDGKGESIWDRFVHTPGNVKGGTTGDVACDSYHRYKEDLELLKKLKLKSYRLSVSWPRIQPNGAGAPNQKGLDYYKRLADALHEAKIRPLCTLYHWDLPQKLEDAGGWPNRDLAGRFADYAEIVTRALGDHIIHWCIFNEPWVFTFLGYAYGTHAPGRKNFLDCMRATHVVNLAQGQAFRAMKAVNSKFQVGTAFSMYHCQPATSSEEDRKAADRAHALANVWFVHPALRGEYPVAFPGPTPLELMGVKPGDLELCRAPLDFLGINYYRRQLISAIPPGAGDSATGVHYFDAQEGPLTDYPWEVWPDGFYEMVMRIAREYKGTPMEITENGCSYKDGPDEHGRVADQRRIDFTRGYLHALGRAIKDGADVRTYHYWSSMDNFEWAEGFTQRFGLAYVDFQTQKRTIKDSGYWYAKLSSTGKLI